MGIRACEKADVNKVVSTMCRAFMDETLENTRIPHYGMVYQP